MKSEFLPQNPENYSDKQSQIMLSEQKEGQPIMVEKNTYKDLEEDQLKP